MSEKKLSSRDEQIIGMRKNGASYAEIACAVETSNQTVYHCLFRAGMTRKGSAGSKLNEAQRAEIAELRRADPATHTYMALSVRFGVQPPTINKILRAAGLTKQRA